MGTRPYTSCFFFSSRRRHTRFDCDWSSDVCSSDLVDSFEPGGKPRHHRGVGHEPGIYFLGLPWLSRRGSSFLWGVWHDAKFVADHIAKQRRYSDYDAPARSRSQVADSETPSHPSPA